MARRSQRRPFRAQLPFAPQEKAVFRWRGTGISRLEGLADAVFAFTVTLLVVALEVPRDYTGLIAVIKDFPAFVMTFAMLMWFWTIHYTFFRRYGLENGWTLFLNCMVLLLVVFMAYPLKFLIGSAFASVLSQGEAATGINGLADLSSLYIIYGLGLGSVWTTFFLMYYHAFRQRLRLRLSEAEIILTRGSLCEMGAKIAICLSSILLALFNRFTWEPGVIYVITGPAMGFIGAWHGLRAKQAFDARKSRRESNQNSRPVGSET